MRSDAADFMHLRADLSRCIAGKSGAINYLIILRAKAAHCQGAAAYRTCRGKMTYLLLSRLAKLTVGHFYQR